uniref:Flavoprotein n=1 Tax=Paulinella longichromatophora TaxID=1708747 RepID=A0A2H4ZPG3_9EUKA|nr:flavoprotein [Paulinella longichromatophora]
MSPFKSQDLTDKSWKLIVIGGGAAGFMTAITAAEAGIKQILILESTARSLNKVRISGGGRCNITHACWNPKDLTRHYPRGNYDLLSPLSAFGTGDAVAWFADHGLDLVQELDGRMFPVSHSSDSVVDTLIRAAKIAKIRVEINTYVEMIAIQPSGNLKLSTRNHYQSSNDVLTCDRVVLATGSHPSGHRLAIQLGHKIVTPAPSLFTISLQSKDFQHLAGVVVDPVFLKLNLPTGHFSQKGPLLITHYGFSGPVTLKLTAFAAFALQKVKYRTSIEVDWTGGQSSMELLSMINNIRQNHAKRQLINWRPWPELSRRIWIYIIQNLDIDPEKRWADVSNLELRTIVASLLRSSYLMKGKGPFGEEFVTSGGVSLDEVYLSTMQSKIIPQLYVAGEIMNVDGITGGFNFQHCWSSGWLAGQSIAASLR